MAEKPKHPGMTNAEFKALGEYLRDMADVVGLRDWHFDLMHGVPKNDDGSDDTNAGAKIEILWGKRYAQVWVEENFRALRPDRQRQFILHELVHCHFDHLDTLTGNKFRDHLGEMYWQGWHQGYWLLFENSIDAIAHAWAEKLPLIKWPSKRKRVKRK